MEVELEAEVEVGGFSKLKVEVETPHVEAKWTKSIFQLLTNPHSSVTTTITPSTNHQ